MVVLGVGLTSLLVPLHFAGVTPVLVSLVSILFTTLYVCITAYYVHQQGIRLAQARSEVEAEQAKAARLAAKAAQ